MTADMNHGELGPPPTEEQWREIWLEHPSKKPGFNRADSSQTYQKRGLDPRWAMRAGNRGIIAGAREDSRIRGDGKGSTIELVSRWKRELHGEPGGNDHDLNAGRRTAKKKYGEELAKAWGQTVPGRVSVENVGDCNPKRGYDVLVVLADGRELHIEAKAAEGNGDTVAITEGEREHNQDLGCEHEEVLFVVSDVTTEIINGEWKCSGGAIRIMRNWKITRSDLTHKSWYYKVPQLMPVQIVTNEPET